MFTKEVYDKLAEAFEFYNDGLFESELPETIITLQRKRNARGFFGYERFISRDENNAFTLSEIALNPECFNDRTDKEILSTMVHEMCHLWQAEFGEKLPKRAYHNREWADKMIQVGLTPSHDGTPDGNQTGVKMTHYITEDGPFLSATNELMESGFKLPFEATMLFQATAADKSKNKSAYKCPSCDAKAWAKGGCNIVCGECHVNFVLVGGKVDGSVDGEK